MKIKEVYGLIKILRFKQWIKNGFVFAPLVFSGQIANIESVEHASFATLIFCLTSSVVYILNDILDVSNDRRHPTKSKSRPIASGEIEIYQAVTFMVLLSSVVLFGLWAFPQLILPISLYLLLNIGYSLWLKNQPVLDIFCIASGFTLRTFAGTTILNTAMSPWLFITVLSLALFLASIKRRQELINIGTLSRSNLKNYSLELINKYAEISATGALIFYSLFVISVRPELVVTIPFVIFGIFRYWYIVEKEKKGESPTDVLINDWQLLFNIVVWLLLSAYLIK